VRTLNQQASIANSARLGAPALKPSNASASAELSQSQPSQLGALPEERVRRILGMVESGRTFTIRDLAVELKLSASYLQRLFKHETGLSMGEWLSERRLQKAAQLLVGSYLSVKEIAHTVGYEHSSSFIRAFERRFSQPPSLYRRRSAYTKS
jgi:AraC-like DNA-binding protein